MSSFEKQTVLPPSSPLWRVWWTVRGRAVAQSEWCADVENYLSNKFTAQKTTLFSPFFSALFTSHTWGVPLSPPIFSLTYLNFERTIFPWKLMQNPWAEKWPLTHFGPLSLPAVSGLLLPPLSDPGPKLPHCQCHSQQDFPAASSDARAIPGPQWFGPLGSYFCCYFLCLKIAFPIWYLVWNKIFIVQKLGQQISDCLLPENAMSSRF